MNPNYALLDVWYSGSDEGMIEDVLEWTFKNKQFCDEIGANGQKYALSKLTRDAAIRRIAQMMDEHPSIISSGPLL